jgi:RNase H-fold protein (predicted Holliday junction resolvase)
LTGQNREYIVIRDKARIGVTMSDETFSTVKIVNSFKEHNRIDIKVTEKSKLSNHDNPYPFRTT